jgi:hypothetical protein
MKGEDRWVTVTVVDIAWGYQQVRRKRRDSHIPLNGPVRVLFVILRFIIVGPGLVGI